MSLDIKTSSLEPKRQAYGYIARRYGEDRPASRYDEAVLDVQATTNFHYRPLWAPDKELYDPSRTRIVMADWYALRDPRQLYYATYNISRAKMDAANQANVDFVEESSLLADIEPVWREQVVRTVVAMRHYEWGANMNNYLVADYGFGTMITSAAAFCAMDRLGMAQILSQIGLMLDDHSGKALDQAKTHWLEDEAWQPTRHAMEDLFVVEDWFETFVAQNLVLDGVLHPLVFDELDAAGRKHGAMGISMMTDFMRKWRKDHERWVDAIVDVAAKESDANRATLTEWVAKWRPRADEAAAALATVLGDGADAATDQVREAFAARLKKLSLEEADR